MTTHATEQQIQNALLVGIQLPKISDGENKASLDELSRLVTTLGYRVIGRTSQKQGSTKMAHVVGEGKLHEIAQWTGGTGSVAPGFVAKKHKAALKFVVQEEEPEPNQNQDQEKEPEEFDSTPNKNNVNSEKAQIVIFDCDLSPSQLRNLESATGVPVLDRTGVIIEIFSRHAKTKTARLQVEIARLTYVAPRLRETGGDEDRGGGGVGAKGAGETSIELDRRKIRDRIAELKRELAALGQEHQIRRQKRNQEITVALVGYTNAGKSSLMRALTGSDVLVADKLFATLDTTVRTLFPETKPKILVSDTVGFIKKLPHDLVASFKSTLDEATHANLLLYVVDSSDVAMRAQLEVTQNVLAEVGAGEVPNLLVLNKMDQLSDPQLMELKNQYPQALFISTRNPKDIQTVKDKIISYFEASMQEATLIVPFNTPGAIGEIRSLMKVLKEEYDEQGQNLTVRGKETDIARIKKKFGL